MVIYTASDSGSDIGSSCCLFFFFCTVYVRWSDGACPVGSGGMFSHNVNGRCSPKYQGGFTDGFVLSSCNAFSWLFLCHYISDVCMLNNTYVKVTICSQKNAILARPSRQTITSQSSTLSKFHTEFARRPLVQKVWKPRQVSVRPH